LVRPLGTVVVEDEDAAHNGAFREPASPTCRSAGLSRRIDPFDDAEVAIGDATAVLRTWFSAR